MVVYPPNSTSYCTSPDDDYAAAATAAFPAGCLDVKHTQISSAHRSEETFFVGVAAGVDRVSVPPRRCICLLLSCWETSACYSVGATQVTPIFNNGRQHAMSNATFSLSPSL